MRRLAIAFALVAIAASPSCVLVTADERPSPPPPAPAYRPVSTPPAPTPLATESLGRATTEPAAPSLVFESLDGADAARAKAAFAPTRATLRRCRPGSGGAIRLRVTATGSKVHYAVEPDTTLGALQRRCVLEALSTIDVGDIASVASPSDRAPSGFNAQLRIEW